MNTVIPKPSALPDDGAMRQPLLHGPTGAARSSITITWNPNREQYEVRFIAPEESFKQIIKEFKKVDFEHRSYNGGNHVWSFSPVALDQITRIAVRWFHNAQLVEGERTMNLHTGRAVSQLTLFGA